MGSKTTNWCDRCGEKTAKLTAWVSGTPSMLWPSSFGSTITPLRRPSKEHASLCDGCLEKMELEYTACFKYKNNCVSSDLYLKCKRTEGKPNPILD